MQLQTDERVLALLAKNIPDRHRELTKFGAMNGWQLAREFVHVLISQRILRQRKRVGLAPHPFSITVQTNYLP